jgi:N-acetylmuramoyl-L-alanine amidase
MVALRSILRRLVPAAVMLLLAGCATGYRLEPGAELGDCRVEATAERLVLTGGAGSLVFRPESVAATANGAVKIELPFAVPYSAGEYLLEKRLLDRIVKPYLARPPASERRIVLDPGHGGREPGAPGALVPEKAVNLAVVLKLKQELEKRGFTVLTTRDTDRTVSLKDRVDFADAAGPALFVSIHHDSARNRAARGYSVYAGRDNSPFPGASFALALAIQSRIVKLPEVVDRGVRFANFRVLSAGMPAVLVELGFISNADEEKLMNDPARQAAEAAAIADGIVDYCRGTLP